MKPFYYILVNQNCHEFWRCSENEGFAQWDVKVRHWKLIKDNKRINDVLQNTHTFAANEKHIYKSLYDLGQITKEELFLFLL